MNNKRMYIYQTFLSKDRSDLGQFHNLNELKNQQKGLSKNSEKYKELQKQIDSNNDAIRDAKIQQFA